MGKRGNEASLERPRVSVLFLIGRKIAFKEMEIRRIVKTKFKTRINVSLLKDIAYIYIYISPSRGSKARNKRHVIFRSDRGLIVSSLSSNGDG